MFLFWFIARNPKIDGQTLANVWVILCVNEFIVFIIVVGCDCVNTKDGIVFRLVPVLLWKSASWWGPRKANALFDLCWIEGEKTWLVLKERMNEWTNEKEFQMQMRQRTSIFFIYSFWYSTPFYAYRKWSCLSIKRSNNSSTIIISSSIDAVILLLKLDICSFRFLLFNISNKWWLERVWFLLTRRVDLGK